MPEGHTIHRLARDLERDLATKPVRAISPQGRFELGAARIDGRRCDGFDAYGKHLIGHFDGGETLHVHLGLVGKFRRHKGEPVGAVRLRLSDDDLHWDLRGPMVCTIGSPELADRVAASVGPDPLDPAADPAEFAAAMRKRRIAVGAALLDQKVIAGIGNVYRAELLFLAGIDPRVAANTLDDAELSLLWTLATEQLEVGVNLNRIVTVDPEPAGYRTPRSIPAGERLYVYKRDGEPCRVCSSEIVVFELAARKMWMCPRCQ